MKYESLKSYLIELSKILYAEPTGSFQHPCIVVTKNSSYPQQLWDWGNWLNNIALRQIARFQGKEEKLVRYEKGSVYNFLNEQRADGSIDIVIASEPKFDLSPIMPHKNVHKPVLAQHVAFIYKYTKDIAWVREVYPSLEKFIAYYENNAKHESGLFYFFDDFAIGVDNDPSTFYRPDNSSASIFINSLMFAELGAMVYLAQSLDLQEKSAYYQGLQNALKEAINCHCILQTPLPVLRDLDPKRLRTPEFAEKVRLVANKHGLPLIDHFESWKNDPAEFYLHADALHPNAEGHVKIAHDIFRALDIFDCESSRVCRFFAPDKL